MSPDDLRRYALAVGLPADSDHETVSAAVRACRAHGVARLDQIPKGPALMAPRTTPPPRDMRSQTLAAKAKTTEGGELAERVNLLTDEAIVSWVASVPPAQRASLVGLVSGYPVAAAKVQRAIAELTRRTANAPPAPGTLTAREREYCREFGTDERTYLRLRDERDAKAAKAKAAQLDRRRTEREAMSRAAAALRGDR